ncbi:MAG TPA: TonB family protein [Pyrinomonadaceae bacterium]|nr:TonB family protein [Pyrinomonadaceae bacterium]
MFTNLIESSSHVREFKRRGSFFLFTTVSYVLLFAIAGLASIYAYDARLEDQDTATLVMLNPVDLPAPAAAPMRNSAPPRASSSHVTVPERADRMASVNTPQVVPDRTSATPNLVKPVPDRGPYAVTGRDVDPIGQGVPGSHGVAANGTIPAPSVELGTPPPPVPVAVEKPRPQIIHKNVINGQALSLPKPPYPPIARQLHIQGVVSIQVLVDESGRVVSAKAIAGNPALVTAAQQAALQARFSPTFLGDQAMKVSGVITYNFMLDH